MCACMRACCDVKTYIVGCVHACVDAYTHLRRIDTYPPPTLLQGQGEGYVAHPHTYLGVSEHQMS